jgi:hypothetical protein
VKVDLDKLEAIAKAATPGPWRWGDWDATFGTVENPRNMRFLERNLTAFADPAPYKCSRQDGRHGVLTTEEFVENDKNREYVAAMSPDVVLSMIDELGFARQQLARYKLALEAAADDGDCALCGEPDGEHDEGCDLAPEPIDG